MSNNWLTFAMEHPYLFFLLVCVFIVESRKLFVTILYFVDGMDISQLQKEQKDVGIFDEIYNDIFGDDEDEEEKRQKKQKRKERY